MERDGETSDVEEVWKGYVLYLILQEVFAMKDTGKIQELLRYIGENYVHRIVGGIFPAMSQGIFVGIPGTVEAKMSVL